MNIPDVSQDPVRERVRRQWFSIAYHGAFAMLSMESGDTYRQCGDAVRALLETQIAMGEVASMWLAALNMPNSEPMAAKDWESACAALQAGCEPLMSLLYIQIDEVNRGLPIRSEPTAAESLLLKRMGRSHNEAHMEARALYQRLGGDPDELLDFASLMAMVKADAITTPPTLPDLPHAGMKN